ncbi:porphobilinogen synthase [Nonomuraea typhae]|uniref:porphobilinogen synthase n=1 Tax=Nonomuraea typhae TaxID=2603600 RepID=UPI0012F73E82|nr:porphobilinogen synthase [Nonomuraea typhae]
MSSGIGRRRPRRLRRTPALRGLAAEHRMSPGDLVLPLFVKEGITDPVPVPSMPGVVQHTADSVRKAAARAAAAGVGGLLLFGVPAFKDDRGSGADAEDGVVQRALRDLAADLGGRCVLMADLCMCEYTAHGHCGLIQDGQVDNDTTLARYQAIALSQAAESAPAGGDRAGHQRSPANAGEALREVALDLEEGADAVMVKPALGYLDVVRRVADAADVPVAAYQVSGEYAMLEAAAAHGWLDRRRAVAESLLSIRRAGADLVITYWALEAAEELLR